MVYRRRGDRRGTAWSPQKALSLLALTLAVAGPVSAQSVTGQYGGVGLLTGNNGANGFINDKLGATTFYNQPEHYTGTRAVIMVMDAGHLYNQHELLNHSTVRLDYLNQNPNSSLTLVPEELLDLNRLPANWNSLSAADKMTFALNNTDLGEVDSHGTNVAGAAAGRLGPANGDGGASLDIKYPGIAFGAQLWSGATASNWTSSLSFESSASAFFYPSLTAMVTGAQVPVAGGGTTIRQADVVNFSVGYGDPTNYNNTNSGDFQVAAGIDIATTTFDAFAAMSGKTLVVSAGNSGVSFGANGTVLGPASGYNVISVGALDSPNGGTYDTIGSFSSRGAMPYAQRTGADLNNAADAAIAQSVNGVRARVDLVAPGTGLVLADYTGATGGNGNPPTPGYVDNSPGSTISYRTLGGTSFAAPQVAGGVALVADVGYDKFGGGEAVHANVIKAILLNSADKLTGWTNGLTNVGGVLTTTQALDYNIGAGVMNLDRAFTNYTTGTNNVPGLGGGTNLAAIGWDFGQVSALGMNDYFIGTSLAGNSEFRATLNWFVGRDYDGMEYVNTTFNSLNIVQGNPLTFDNNFIDLDLEFWEVIGGVPTNLIAVSSADYLNTEHLYFNIPRDGNYMIRVHWVGERYNFNNVTTMQYGLAWLGTGIAGSAAAPEPGVICLVGVGLVGLFIGRRRV